MTEYLPLDSCTWLGYPKEREVREHFNFILNNLDTTSTTREDREKAAGMIEEMLDYIRDFLYDEYERGN